MKKDFDLAVIGAGAGGLFASSVANTLRAKVCLIEKDKLGGECTWSGCIPSKTLIKSAHVAHLTDRLSEFGLKSDINIKLNTESVMSHVRDVIREVAETEIPDEFKKRGIEVVIRRPKFIDRNSLEVNSDKITAKRFIICTGSVPFIPPIQGLGDIDYLTNENIFSLSKLPQSLIVLGGGAIGIELAQAISRLGVEVTVIEMMDRILMSEDAEVAYFLERKLENEGIKVLTGKKATKFYKQSEKIHAMIEDKEKNQEEVLADSVLVAVGRVANTKGLDLEKAQVEYNNKGIKVNDYLQTTNKSIFACGDIVPPYLFTHVASYEASICVRNALFRKLAWQKVNYNNIAWANFTDPEIFHLGLTEEQVRNKYKNVNVYKTDYKDCDRAKTEVERDGFVKVITDKKGHILGAHIIGYQASEIGQGLLIAKSNKIKFSKIANTLFVYPTLSELIKKTAAKPLSQKMRNPLVKFILKVMRKI